MERNAAGDVIAHQYHSATTTMHHVAPTSSASVVRFKLYFNASPPTTQANSSSSGSQPPLVPVHQRGQLTHLMVPFRLPMAGVTLQDLADQAVTRISKRYPQLTQQCDVEGFDVVPLVWESGGGGTSPQQSHGPSSSSDNQGGKAQLASPTHGAPPSTQPQPPSASGASYWTYDVASTYRLDLAMNGLDDLEFYFDLPPQGGSASLSTATSTAAQLQLMMAISSPPPFELIVIWRQRHGRHGTGESVVTAAPPLLPAAQTLPLRCSTPNRSMPPYPGAHGGRCSPSPGAAMSQHTTPPPVSKAPLPPLHSNRNPPSRLPALEPRRPNDGAARYRQATPDTPPVDDVALPALPSEGLSPDTQRITGGHHAGVATPSISARASNEEQDIRLQGGSAPFRRISSEQLLALDELNTSTPRNSSAISPTRASAGVKGGSGRRSVTTFLEQRQQDDGLAASCQEHPSSALTRTTSPNDSEANLEDVITFQSQLIQMTEAEDRDTIHIQEAMELSLVVKAKQVELAVAQTGGRPPPSSTHSASISVSSSLSSPRARPPQQHQQLPLHNTLLSDALPGLKGTVVVESGVDAGLPTKSMHVEAASPVARAPRAAPSAQAVVPAASSGQAPVACNGRHQATSASSVEAAALFAVAPTSRAVLERLMAESNAPPNPTDREGRQRSCEGSPTPSSDNEALLLACDELLNDWFHLRHVVLTEERKEFRVLSQQFKCLQREQFSDMTTMIRNEALGVHAKHQQALLSQSPSRREVVAASPSKSASVASPSGPHPASSLPRTLTTAEEASTVGLEMTPSLFGHHPEAPKATKLEALTPVPPPGGPPADIHPSRGHYSVMVPLHRMDEALLRLIKIVDVTEQSERRELKDEEAEYFKQWFEEQAIGKKRIQLRAEQALILHERQLLQDELALRSEIANVEDRKFSMFTGLCEKGIQRLRSASAASPSTKAVNTWMEL